VAASIHAAVRMVVLKLPNAVVEAKPTLR